MNTPTNRYEMRSRIATGGMGEVWRAEDSVLGREVAVKVLKGEYAGDPTFRSRFETEARHAASLHHPNIATVFDYGENESEDGGPPRPFLVMELVEGKPLSDLILPDRPMAPEKVRDLLGQAAGALALAHANGIVHRDVKPANLLVTPAGQVKVTDFGIARAADGVALTSTGEVIGTPHYLSPEQAQGRPATPASDVYALGVVLFECLTGGRPFAGQTPVATALAHVREPIPALPADIPADLAAVTRRALSKDPADRYPDAASFATALAHGPAAVPPPPSAAAPTTTEATQVMAAPTTVPTGAVPPPDQRPRQRRGPPSWWPIAAVGALALVVVVALLLNQGDPSPTAVNSDPSTTPRASAKPVRTTPKPSTTPTVSTARIVEADLVGLGVDQAKARLAGLGFDQVSTETRTNADGKPADTVADVSPTGDVDNARTITLGVWDAPPATPTAHTSEPTAATSSSPPASPGAGSTHAPKRGKGRRK